MDKIIKIMNYAKFNLPLIYQFFKLTKRKMQSSFNMAKYVFKLLLVTGIQLSKCQSFHYFYERTHDS